MNLKYFKVHLDKELHFTPTFSLPAVNELFLLWTVAQVVVIQAWF
jgi:hypothetical protein